MATTASTLPSPTPVEWARHLGAAPLKLLIYLYEAQLRLDWLQGSIDKLRQQSDALSALASAPRTSRMVGNIAREAIAEGASEIDQLVSAGIPLQRFRNDLEYHYRNLFPSDQVADGSPLTAVSVAALIQQQSGQSVLAAANAIPDGTPRVNLTQPPPIAGVLRNNRLLRRYGNGSQTASIQNLEPGTDTDTNRLRTYYAAYKASWATQAKLFATGFNVEGNANLRRWIFRDKSYVEIQAHRPGLARSDDSQFSRVSAVSAVVATGGVLAGGIGACVGLSESISRLESLYPQDAAWQGYTIRYFQNEGSTQPWATRYFYGWKRAAGVSRAVQINGTSDPSKFANFANTPDQFSWWKWSENTADILPPQADKETISVATSAQKLIETIAGTCNQGHATLSDTFASTTRGNTPLVGETVHPSPLQLDRSFLRFG